MITQPLCNCNSNCAVCYEWIWRKKDRTLTMRQGRAAWVWVMFQMSLLHPSSHTPRVSTRHSGQYIRSSAAHSFIASSLARWELPDVSWSPSACVSVALPQGPGAHLTPAGIAVDTSGDFVFLLWACGTCQKRLKSQLVHLCSASVPMMADLGRTLTLELQRTTASVLGSYLLCCVASWYYCYCRAMTCSAEVCIFSPHSVIKHPRNFCQRTSCRCSYFMQENFKIYLWSWKDQMLMGLMCHRCQNHWRASLTA